MLREGTRVGTSFFVHTTNRYLVSAAHVAEWTTDKTAVVVWSEGDRPLTFELRELVGPSGVKWIALGSHDLAVLKLDSSTAAEQLTRRFLPTSMFATVESAPKREYSLTVLGFPVGLGTAGHFSPLSLKTKAASGLLTLPRPDLISAAKRRLDEAKTHSDRVEALAALQRAKARTAAFFATQDPSIGGYSGAPVFDLKEGMMGTSRMTLRSGPPEVVGVVDATISDDTGGKLGLIIPAAYVLQAIQKAEGN